MGEVRNLGEQIRPEAIDALLSVHSLYAFIRYEKALRGPLVSPAAESGVQGVLYSVSDKVTQRERNYAWQELTGTHAKVSPEKYAVILKIQAEDTARREALHRETAIGISSALMDRVKEFKDKQR